VSPDDERHSLVDPEAHQKIVGSTFARAEHKAIVTIGKRSWSKWDLGRIGCPHPSAAVRVQRLITALDIRTPAQFLERAHEFGKFKDLGVVSYWTVLALARDLGGDIEEVHGEDVSFHAIHNRALKAQRDGANSKRKRKRA
jgi:hypothetical protein